MKDEIKEILDRMKDDIKEHWHIAYEPDVELSFDEAKLLLDYITNLQEENENLKDYLKIMEKGKDNNLNRFLDYKSRCEKAINYIMTELITEWDIKNDGYVSGSDLPVDAITPLLNILQGEENE